MATGQALLSIAVWLSAGMILGLASTIFGAARSVYQWPPVLAAWLDWLFATLVGPYVFVVLLWTIWGSFRLWAILWIFLGYGLWVATLGSICSRPLRRILRTQARVAGALWRFVDGALWHGPIPLGVQRIGRWFKWPLNRS